MALATVGDVIGILDALGLPNTNLKWESQQAPKPPYAVLVPHASRNDYADGGVHFKCRDYDVELYTREYDVPLQQCVSNALDGGGISYSSDVYVDESNQFCVTYFQMTLIEQEANNG